MTSLAAGLPAQSTRLRQRPPQCHEEADGNCGSLLAEDNAVNQRLAIQPSEGNGAIPW